MERKDFNHFKSFTDWLPSLRNVPEDVWIAPIAEGKWAIQGLISHMVLWDKYFLENAIHPVVNHEPITLPETFDFDDFNRDAVEYGKKHSKEELISEGIHYRNEIVRHIANLSDEEYFKQYPNFQVAQYVIEFVEHDDHHKAQVDSFLNR